MVRCPPVVWVSPGHCLFEPSPDLRLGLGADDAVGLAAAPHHGAHRSSATGSGERSTSAAKVASVTVTGPNCTGSGVLHRPHTGARPCLTLSSGTRLSAPQEGQRITG